MFFVANCDFQISSYDSVILRKHKKSLTHPFKDSESAYKSVLVIFKSLLFNITVYYNLS